MRIRPSFLSLRTSLVLLGISFCFVLSLVYVVREIMDHADLLFVIYLMAASGFVMMVVLWGTILNIHRLHHETKGLYLKVKKQMRAIESSGDGIAILDGKGVFNYMNKAHAACYGYLSPEELIGKKWDVLYNPSVRDYIEREIFPVVSEQGRWSGRSQGLKTDGTIFPQEVSLNLLEDGGLICVVRDLSEKIENETLLRLIKVAVEAAQDGIAITDSENRLLFTNRSFLNLHGYDPYERESFLGTDWRLLYNDAGQEQINSTVLPTMILKGTWSGEITVMRKDGGLFYADASLTKLPDGIVLGVVRDISERRKEQIEHEALKGQLFQSQKMEAINRLTSGIAHDFNKIMTAIHDQALILSRDLHVPQKWRDQTRSILSETDQAKDLVDQLLAFSHKKDGKSGLMDLKERAAEIKQSFEINLPPHIECILDVKVLTAYIHASPAHFKQILINVLLNAEEAIVAKRGKIAVTIRETDRNILGIKHMMMLENPPDRAKVSPVRICQVRGKYFLMAGYLVKGKNYLQLTVADTGTGIAPDILDNIFDPFFTTKGMNKGAGLGLSTVHGMIIGGNGAIVVETMPGEGTSIHLFFPKASAVEYEGIQNGKMEMIA